MGVDERKRRKGRNKRKKGNRWGDERGRNIENRTVEEV